jgi:hypothetical protein
MDSKRINKVKSYILTFILLLSMTFIPEAKAAEERKWSIHGSVRYSLLTPKGEMGVSNNSNVDKTDLSDLGLDSADGAWGISIGGNYGRPHFFFSGQKSSFSGTGTTSKDMSQGPVTIPAGTPVDTSMDIGIYTVVATYDFIPGKNELGIGLGVMGLDFGVNYTAVSTGAQINIDETYPLPLLAVNGSLNWKKIELAALVGGAYIQISGSEVGYLNADIAARYAFYKGENWSGMASLGYRYIGMGLDIKENNDRFKADINFTGPYIGVRFKY